jgi:YcxB-like protein
MDYTLSYRSTRGDVWRWYWRMWRRKFWVVHLLLSAFIVAVMFQITRGPLFPLLILLILCFVAIVVVLSSVPQILFKSATRTLVVSESGWVTTIGSKSGARRWNEIGTIEENATHVILTTNSGSAMLIPRTAFATEEQAQHFVAQTRQWKAHAG